MVPLRRALFSTASVAFVVACSSYGAEDPTPSDGGASSSSGGSSSGGSSSGGTSSGGGSDASLDGGLEACPPCQAGTTCLPAGCSGAGDNNACNKPFDVTASGTIVVFACPAGPTTPLPDQPACLNGGPKHGALLRLGTAPNTWKITVQGQNPFVVVGDCASNNVGACSTSSLATKDVNPLLSVFVGTSTKDLAACVQLNVTLTQQ